IILRSCMSRAAHPRVKAPAVVMSIIAERHIHAMAERVMCRIKLFCMADLLGTKWAHDEGACLDRCRGHERVASAMHRSSNRPFACQTWLLTARSETRVFRRGAPASPPEERAGRRPAREGKGHPGRPRTLGHPPVRPPRL